MKLCVVAWVLLASLARGAPPEACDGGVESCQTCRDGEGAATAMVNLPRYSPRLGGSVPADLGEYVLFSCDEGEEGDSLCSVDGDSLTDDLSGGPADATSIVAYVEGVGMYVAFAVVMALFLPLFAVVFCLCRTHCCCCCCCKNGCCGKGIPTQRDKTAGFRMSGCCGFEFIGKHAEADRTAVAAAARNRDSAEGSSGGRHPRRRSKHRRSASRAVASRPGEQDPLSPETARRIHYRPIPRLIVRGMMILYSVFTIIFASVGITSGTDQLAQAAKDLAAAPTGAVSLVRTLRTPLGNAIFNVGAGVLAPLIRDLNATLNAEADMGALIDNVVCMIDLIDTALPNTTTLLGFVDDVDEAASAILGAAHDLSAAVSELDGELITLNGVLDDADELLDDVDAGTTALSSSISSASSTLNSAATHVDALTNSQTGAGAIADDLLAYSSSRVDPSSARAARGELQATVSTLLYAHNATGSAERAQMLTRLNSIVTGFQGYPDFGTLATNLVAANDTLNAVADDGTVENIINALLAVNSTLATIPSTQEALALLDRLESIAESFDLANITNALNDFQAAVDTIPSFAVLQTELDNILKLEGIVDCADGVLAEVNAIHRSVIGLPDSILELLEDARNMSRDALNDATGQIEDFNSTLVDVEDTIDSLPSVSDYLDDIETLEDALVQPVDFSSLCAEFDSYGSSIDDADITTFVDDAETLQTWIEDPASRPSAQLVDTLRALDSVIGPLLGNLTAAVSALNTWDTTTRCVDMANYGQPCTVGGGGSPCADADCQGGVGVCLPVPGSGAGTPCFASAGCGGGTCSLDGEQALATAYALDFYADEADAEDTSELTSLTPTLTEIGDSADSLPSMSSQVQLLDDLEAALDSVDISAARADLQSVRSNADRDALQIPTIQTNIDDATNAAEEFTGSVFDEIRSALDSVDSASADVRDQIEQLDDVREAAETAKNYLFFSLPYDLKMLEGGAGASGGRTSLAEARDADGITGMLINMGRLVDRALAELGRGSDTLDFRGDLEGEKEISDIVGNAIRVFEDDDLASAGALHYVLSIVQAAANTSQVDFEPPLDVVDTSTTSVGSVFLDADGVRYADDAYCFTQDCIDATVDEVYTGDGEAATDGAVPALPMAPSQMLALTYSFPIILAVLALLPAVCCCRCCGSCCARWQAGCVSCLQIGMCLQLFFVFLLAGAFYFPIVMVGSDACATGVNVAANFVDINHDYLCREVIGGEVAAADDSSAGGSGSCIVSVDTVDVYIPVRDLAAVALGGTCDGREDIVAELIDSFRPYVVEKVRTQVNDTIEMANDMADDITLRPATEELIREAGDNVTAVALALLDDLAEHVTCASLSDVVGGARDGMCCTLLDAGYWAVTAWYMIAFAVCFCGWPAAVLGYKRFPAVLWGSQYEDVVSLLQPEPKDSGGRTPVTPHRVSVTPPNGKRPELAGHSHAPDSVGPTGSLRNMNPIQRSDMASPHMVGVVPPPPGQGVPPPQFAGHPPPPNYHGDMPVNLDGFKNVRDF